MHRYLYLLRTQLRTSLLLGMQYRADFLIDGLISLFWTVTAVTPLFIIFRGRDTIAGWTYHKALLVTGWFTLLSAILEGGINPSLTGIVDHIRKGTLDFVLLKPADAQFLVSTSRFEPWRATNILTAVALFTYAFAKMHRLPSPTGLLEAVLLLGCATLLLYSLWILTASAAFYVVKVDNLTYLFESFFDAARWPIDVFRGAMRFVFTFLIPLALMTTFPARAMVGELAPTTLLFSLLGAVAFAALARAVWIRSIAHYTSASS